MGLPSSKLSSNILYHYTKSAENVVSILENGFYPKVVIESISILQPKKPNAYMGIPMVCFTDMPIQVSDEHREEYGQFVIGMKKEWAINWKICPIMYVIEGSKTYEAFNHLQYEMESIASKLDILEANKYRRMINATEAIWEFAGFLRTYSRDLYNNVKPFYDEREWRYIPPAIGNRCRVDGVEIGRHLNRLYIETTNIDAVYDNKKSEINDINEYVQRHYRPEFNIDNIEELCTFNKNDFAHLSEMIVESSLSQKEEYMAKMRLVN